MNRVLSDWVWDPWTMRASPPWPCCGSGGAERCDWRSRVGGGLPGARPLVQQLLKAAVGRDRPEWPDPVDSAHFAAYPSGHAMTATVVCGLVVWVLHRLTAARPVLVAALDGGGGLGGRGRPDPGVAGRPLAHRRPGRLAAGRPDGGPGGLGLPAGGGGGPEAVTATA